MDENTALALIQTLHNLGGILFAAGPFHVLLLLQRHKSDPAGFDYWHERRIEERLALLPPLWLWLLLMQLASGAGFGAASYLFHGELPAMGSIARVAISVKIGAAVIAATLSFHLWHTLAPALRRLVEEIGNSDGGMTEALVRLDSLQRRREGIVYMLILLALAILTGAAFLRWNM